MNFALAPKKVPTKEIIASVEQGIKYLPNDKKNEVREKVCAVVKRAKCPQNNLSRVEEKALKNLRSNKDIVIIKADKGNAVVVMNRVDYQNQVSEMLEDKNIYTRITDKRRNPTSKIESELQVRLLRLKDAGHITDNQYKSLRPSDSYPAAFYGLPKIHKIPLVEKVHHFTVDSNVKIPMRPINSCIGSPNYQVSKHLASVLKHLYKGEYVVKNSKEFVDFVVTQTVKPDEQIVSFDVISLFTSIPVDLALKIVKEELENTDIWKEHTNLTIEDIYSLLAFVLKNSFFMFNGDHYHQVSGCAMGSPVSAVVAELLMQRVERIALKTSPVPIRWWKRYVDDSNACLKQNDVTVFHDHLNSIDPCIQFTVETPTKNGDMQIIAFLDTEICKISTDISIKVFRKNTHTDKYLDFDSHSPVGDKVAVVKTLLERAKVIPSNQVLQKEETDRVAEVLELNGYKKAFIDSVKSTNKIKQNSSEFDIQGSTCIPYVKGVSEKVKSILTRAGIRTAFKPIVTLADVFKKPKERPQEIRTKAIVYKFKCESCSFTYVGESGRCWCSRWLEHKPGVRKKTFSAIKEHAERTGHDVAKTDVNILEKGIKNYDKRRFLEALHSVLDKNAVNEHIEFPVSYLPLLESIKCNETRHKRT